MSKIACDGTKIKETNSRCAISGEKLLGKGKMHHCRITKKRISDNYTIKIKKSEVEGKSNSQLIRLLTEKFERYDNFCIPENFLCINLPSPTSI